MKTINITFKNKSEENRIIRLLQENNIDFGSAYGGKDRSEKTENRFRMILDEPKPNTTDYDFCCGEGFFFKERVELKQTYSFLSQPKIQQVKPGLYEKILCILENKNSSTFYVIKTEMISKLAGKEHKESGKITLTRQHKGNKEEGQISISTIKKFGTFIGEYPKIDYALDNLGFTNEQCLEILTFVKNH